MTLSSFLKSTVAIRRQTNMTSTTGSSAAAGASAPKTAAPSSTISRSTTNTEGSAIMPATNKEERSSNEKRSSNDDEANTLSATKNKERRSNEAEASNGDQCSICLEPKNEGALWALRQPCGHSFHKECLRHLLNHQSLKRNRCPLCREPINDEDFIWICGFPPEYRYTRVYQQLMLPMMPGEAVLRGFGIPLPRYHPLSVNHHPENHPRPENLPSPFDYPGANAIYRSGFTREPRQAFGREEHYPGDGRMVPIEAPDNIEDAPVMAPDGVINPPAEEEDYMDDLRRRAAEVRERVQIQMGQQAIETGQERVETQAGQRAGEMSQERVDAETEQRARMTGRAHGRSRATAQARSIFGVGQHQVGTTTGRHPPDSMTRLPNPLHNMQVAPESIHSRSAQPVPDFFAVAEQPQPSGHHRVLARFFGVDANYGPGNYNHHNNLNDDDEDIDVTLERIDQEERLRDAARNREAEVQSRYETYVASVRIRAARVSHALQARQDAQAAQVAQRAQALQAARAARAAQAAQATQITQAIQAAQAQPVQANDIDPSEEQDEVHDN